MKNPKLLVISALAGIATLSSASAAILFSGGVGGASVVVTNTTEIRIPITVTQADSAFAGFLLEDVYSTANTAESAAQPLTVYGSLGSISAVLETAAGPTITFSNYNNFGSLNFEYGIFDPTDFYGLFEFAVLTTFQPGDVLVISPGTMTLDPSVPLPDRPITTISAINEYGVDLSAVPEPSSAMLLGLTAGFFLRRRR